MPICVAIVLAAGDGGRAGDDGGGASARTGPIKVTYRSQTAVYVSAGRTAGLAVGDRLGLLSGSEKIAELEVLFLAEHSSSCRVVSETRPVKPGDKLVRLGAPRPAPPADATREFTVTEPDEPLARRVRDARPRGSRDSQRVGRASRAASPRVSDVSRTPRVPAATSRSRPRAPTWPPATSWGMPLEAARPRQRPADRARGPARPHGEGQRDPAAALRSVGGLGPAGGPVLRRRRAPGRRALRGLGYLDGVVGQARAASGVHVGGVLRARRPTRSTWACPRGPSTAPSSACSRQGRSPADLGSAPGPASSPGARSAASSSGSRRRSARGNVWLYERMEIDLNRGWRRERAGTRRGPLRGARAAHLAGLARGRRDASPTTARGTTGARSPAG